MMTRDSSFGGSSEGGSMADGVNERESAGDERIDKDEPLRRDVKYLGELLGEVLAEQGGEARFDRVERARLAARDLRDGVADAEDELERAVRGLPVDEAEALVRAFSAYFALVNMAERVHRIRRRRDYLAEGRPQPGSLEAALHDARDGGLDADGFVELLGRLRLTPVFTAHPTEATRRTLLVKEQRVAVELVRRMIESRLPIEEAAGRARLRSEITLSWQTDEHLHDRPTVADEVEHVVFYVTDVIYRIVPAFYDALEDAAARVFGDEGRPRIPAGIVRFGTWVGGDMDGNPNVGAPTIRATLERQRELILERYLGEARELFGHLSHSTAYAEVSAAVEDRVRTYAEDLPEVGSAIPVRYAEMPYRRLLWLMNAKLRATLRDAPGRYDTADELVEDIAILHESLLANRGANAGARLVERWRRRVETFGFCLATLDIREDSLVHRRAAGQLMGDDSFESRDAANRTEALSAALARGHDPGVPLAPESDTELARVLDVLGAIRECRRRFGHDAIGPYIISMAQGVDDALALLWLARRAGLVDAEDAVELDIAPLFETVDDLQSAARVMAALYAHPQYRDHLRSRDDHQVVMLGYSDSNRESGLIASRWALQQAQEELLATSEESGVRLTLFHGRGGTISRGGSKPRNAILAEPPNAVRGRLRLTEQGEIIHAKYGLRDLALRTLELTAGAVIEVTAANDGRTSAAAESVPVWPDEWRAVMERAAATARQTYRALVFDEPDFYEYFRGATPIDVIERLLIGSRPVARRSKSGIENLRAIPWVFAWTQSRHMLPGWYGVGEGLRVAEAEFGIDVLRGMNAEWPFFANLVADVEMVLAKADLNIARQYADLAGDVGSKFFPRIVEAFESTRDVILRITGCDELLANEPVLERAIGLRNPYVDPMSKVQIDLLQRWRDGGREDEALERVLLSTVKGIARGLQNTG